LAVQGTKFSGIEKMLSGPTTLAYSQDPIVAAKILVQYAKTNDKIVVLGGCLNGEVLNAQAINSLASLPSLDELRGKLVGMLVTPATRLAVLAQAPAAQLARVLNAYATK
jgi:large subunit ribosomal protein L10